MRASTVLLAVVAWLTSAPVNARDRDFPASQASFTRSLLDVPYLPQETLLCVPTSAAMILAFYGDPQAPRRLKSFASGRDYNPAAPFNDFTITYYRDMVRAVGRLGYLWTELAFADDADGFRRGLETIQSELDKNHPVMVDVSWPTGHTFVINGIDAAGGRLFIVDPSHPEPGRETLTLAQFEAIWNEHVYGNHFRSLIKAPPKDQVS